MKHILLCAIVLVLVLYQPLYAQTTIAGGLLTDLENEPTQEFSEFTFSSVEDFIISDLRFYREENEAGTYILQRGQDDGFGGVTYINEFSFQLSSIINTFSASGGQFEEVIYLPTGVVTLSVGDYRITGSFYESTNTMAGDHWYQLRETITSNIPLARTTFLEYPVPLFSAFESDPINFYIGANTVRDELTGEQVVYGESDFFLGGDVIIDTLKLISNNPSQDDISLFKIQDDSAMVLEGEFRYIENLEEPNGGGFGGGSRVTDLGVFVYEGGQLSKGHYILGDFDLINPPTIFPNDVIGLNTSIKRSVVNGGGYSPAELSDVEKWFDLSGIVLSPQYIEDSLLNRGVNQGDLLMTVPLHGKLNSSRIQGIVELSYKNTAGDFIHFANVLESSTSMGGSNTYEIDFNGGFGGRHYYLEMLNDTLHFSAQAVEKSDQFTYLELTFYDEDVDNLTPELKVDFLQNYLIEQHPVFETPFVTQYGEMTDRRWSVNATYGYLDNGANAESNVNVSGAQLYLNRPELGSDPNIGIYDEIITELILEGDSAWIQFNDQTEIDDGGQGRDLPKMPPFPGKDYTNGREYYATDPFNVNYNSLISSNSSVNLRIFAVPFVLDFDPSNPLTIPEATLNKLEDFSLDNTSCSGRINVQANLNINSSPNATYRDIRLYKRRVATNERFQQIDVSSAVILTNGPTTSFSWEDLDVVLLEEYEYFAVGVVKLPAGFGAGNQVTTNTTDTLRIAPALLSELPTNLSFEYVSTSNQRYVDLDWTDGGNRNEGFAIYKYWENNQDTIFINNDQSDYRDFDIDDCVTYTYKAGATNACAPEGVFNQQDSVVVLAEPFLREIISPETLITSKGYFSNSVKLDWEFNAESQSLERIKIYKRRLGDEVVPQLIATLNPEQLFYTDEEVETNVFYEYFMLLEGDCATGNFKTFEIQDMVGMTLPADLPGSGVTYDIGFKSESGVVTGNISYEGGIGVPDVKVVVEKDGESSGNALFFDGTDQDTTTIDYATYFDFSDAFTAMMWISPQDTSSARQVLMSQQNKAEIYLDESEIVVRIEDQSNTVHEVRAHHRFDFSAYSQITATISPDSLNLFVNGLLLEHTLLSGFNFNATLEDIKIGFANATDHYHGYIDELRFYNKFLDPLTIKRDHQRTINSENDGLVGYWRFDEGRGFESYDFAKTGNVFHMNDLKLNGADWIDNIPSKQQLSIASYTSQSGNYIIEGINYEGNGENFTITPGFTLNGSIHTFDPQQRVLFIGEGSQVQNNVDFTDNSSFEVSGIVYYAFETTDNDSTLAVEGAGFLLDGITPLFNSENQRVTTDENGEFTISVPIGLHFFNVQQIGHVYVGDGRFPLAGTFDFQDDLAGLTFYDSTLLKLSGKVVGGLREGDKKLGDPTTINNIGQTRFTLQYPAGPTPLLEVLVTTNATNGEYEAELPPLEYLFKDNRVEYFLNSQPLSFNSGAFEAIDLTNAFAEQEDTVHVYAGGILDEIITTKFNSKKDFILRVDPNIQVTERGENKIVGERSFNYSAVEPNINIPLYDDLTENHALGLPVFQKGGLYDLSILLRETYNNIDNGDTDEVPVTDGVLTITNFWGKGFFYDDSVRQFYAPGSEGSVETIQVENENGELIYHFEARNPDPADKSDDNITFTRSLQVTANTGGGNTVFYPGPNGSEVDRAYIFGNLPTSGSSFVTSGPDRVEFILRDPQGSQSSSYWEAGSVLETEETMRWDVGAGLDVDVNTGFELTTWVGVGGGTVNTVGNTVNVNFSQQSKAGEQNTRISTVETTQRYQTSEENVGSNADVFLGRSENFTFGVTTNVFLIPSDQCGASGELCPSTPSIMIGGVAYKVGVKPGFFLSPNGEVTYFAFTQSYIENVLIPSLKSIRNAVLENNTKYTSNFSDLNDPDFDLKYASNNDDPIWGAAVSTGNYPKTDDADFTGPSYTFLPSPAPTIGGARTDEIDSIRWTNQQIRLWEGAILKNEQDKITAIDSSDVLENYSLSGGNRITSEITTSSTTISEEFWELDLATGGGYNTDFSGLGPTVELEFRPSVTSSTQNRTVNTSTSTSTVGFELFDQDDDDVINVDVLNSQFGYGPIFRSRDGGVTSCPHEEAEVTRYYIPGREWSRGTLQVDKPRIEVEVPQVFNVPADQAAVYTINLFNDSETREDQNYLLKLVDGTNQDGAVLRVDGAVITDGREFFVPGGSAIQKTLTMERGPLKYDYDDIQIQLMSSCQNDPTGFFEAIADTISLSARFLPTCTPIEVSTPDQNFTVNNSFGDTVNIEISQYDINFSGLDRILLQYKSSEQNNWVPLETYFRDTTGMNDDEARQIPRDASFIRYHWNISSNIPDGNYDIRAISTCSVPTTFDLNNEPTTFIDISSESDVISGLIDTVDPHPFGDPQPSDGILGAGEEILIRFNEPINTGILRKANFEISGELNNGALARTASVLFDGTDTQYGLIPNSINLTRKSFSIDFYAKRNDNGEEIAFSLGSGANNALLIGFDVADHPYITIGGETLTAVRTISDQNWHHYTFSYNYTTDDIFVAIDGLLDNTDAAFAADFTESGDIFLGKAGFTPSNPFNGNMYELRIWNRPVSEPEIGRIATSKLNATERGLVANWSLDQGLGATLLDHIRNQNGQFFGSWKLEPGGLAYSFDGIGDVIETASPSFTQDQDFTIEFWAKTPTTSDSVTFISNGRADLQGGNSSSWFIGANPTGELFVKTASKSLSTDFIITDGLWHHIALTVNRFSNIVLYVDKTEIVSDDVDGYPGFGGPKLWIGARGWFDDPGFMIDQYLNGSIDEVRIWQLAKRVGHIEDQLYNKLSGEEIGLTLYYPFESYQDIGAGILQAQSDFSNQVSGELAAPNNLTGTTLANFTDQTPPIRLPRSRQFVDFNYSANEDEIILSPQISLAKIEDVILNITARNIRDLNGNKLSSPVTWTAFVDQNTIAWEESELTLEVVAEGEINFSATVQNTGGDVASFQIQNLPAWLSASETSGFLDPLSNKKITFSVSESINIGSYLEDIVLTSSSGYDERLIINIKVIEPLPSTWQVDESAFEFTMSVIGRLRIQGEFSRDADDKLVVFVNGECRGIGDLEYFESFDNYQTFLTIYSNDQSGLENLTYRIWNASEGRIHTNITVSDSQVETFTQEAVFGSILAPVTFEAGNDVQRQIPLVEGWQWVSFNLSSPDMSDVNAFMNDYNAEKNDLIKGFNFFDTYDPETGWVGSISANGGIQNGSMYKFRVSDPGTLDFTGEMVNPSAQSIPLMKGWNWISYLGQENAEINVALANVNNIQVGDQIKNQRAFAIYSGSVAGWVGSLTALKPGEGYLYFAQNSGDLTYPANVNNSTRSAVIVDDQLQLNEKFNVRPERYEFNMQVIAKLENLIGGEIVLLKNTYETVGVAMPIEETGESYYFMTSYGNPSEELSFYLWDDGEEKLITADRKITFEADRAMGSLENPVLLTRNDVVTGYNRYSGVVSIYPNPATDQVFITTENSEGVVKTELRNLTGRVLETYKAHPSQINVSELKSGIYFINLLMQDGKVTSFKIIKQ